MSDEKRAETTVDLLIAAILDAAIEMKLTQFKTTITPEKTGKQTFVRIIIVPEQMEYESVDPKGFMKR